MFFTVKNSLRIGSKSYKPCICYDLEEGLTATIKSLEEKGLAEITSKPVFFQNGKKIEAKKEAVKENLTTEKVKKSKAKSNMLSAEDKEVSEDF